MVTCLFCRVLSDDAGVSAGVSLPNRPQIDPLAADLAATLLILAVLCWRAPASAFGGAPEERTGEGGKTVVSEAGQRGGSIGARRGDRGVGSHRKAQRTAGADAKSGSC
ncbi:hypothetical protein GGI42DRAFT_356084 [Trichoderma sp. SZMC 28013]